MTLPTFFIIGAPKTGTTSLHYYLEQHPDIQMSKLKEPHFFIDSESGVPSPYGRIDRLDTYERLFDPTYNVRGEASPSYTVYPRRKGVPKRIKALISDARFIYLVRDPIARTISHYQHRVAVEGERRSIREALGDLSDPYSIYTCPSLYASQLDHYLSVFPADRILIVDQAELLTNRLSTLCEIFSFLGADDKFDSSRFHDELGTSNERRAYPARYARFVMRGRLSPLGLIPREVRHPIRRFVERIAWPPMEVPSLDSDLRGQLEALYKAEVDRLRSMTGKTFHTWTI